MRANGITYDTGFFVGTSSTHDPFELEAVRRDMLVIRDELHCNAVRPTGGDPERLEVTARIASELDLEVWFSPFTNDLTTAELLDRLADCATRAERLRRDGADVVFVTGAEISLVTDGFLPGSSTEERMALLADPAQLRAAMADIPSRINQFLGQAVSIVRERFGGKITYASIPFERVDWGPFDFVGLDIYRTREIAARFRDAIRATVASGKPVAITEFGCATFRGAADAGATGGMIVDWDGVKPVGLNGDYVRDEAEQATCLRELLEIFDQEGVDSGFVCTFASYNLPHHADPKYDFDLASYGVVKVLESKSGDGGTSTTWQPKEAFVTLADYYGRHSETPLEQPGE